MPDKGQSGGNVYAAAPFLKFSLFIFSKLFPFLIKQPGAASLNCLKDVLKKK